MKIFESAGAFAERLVKLVVTEHEAAKAGLKEAAKLIEKSAKDEIGHLQPSVGPFSAWDELSEATKDDKDRHGYVYNSDYNPLLRTGELYNSISHYVNGMEAVIGSSSQIMVYQEFGTSRIPPRPVLGPAAYKNKEKIKKLIGAAAIAGLIGGKYIHHSLGYDMVIE